VVVILRVVVHVVVRVIVRVVDGRVTSSRVAFVELAPTSLLLWVVYVFYC
jgi:hypothetical protein